MEMPFLIGSRHPLAGRYPGQPNITQPTTHLAKVKWEAPTCGSPNFVGSVVAMLRADWPGFVIHRLGVGTWPQPFPRKTVVSSCDFTALV